MSDLPASPAAPTDTLPSPDRELDAASRTAAFRAALRANPASLFQFDPRMAEGWYSDRYFVRAANTLSHDARDPVVCMQVFAKREGIIAGVYEVVRMLQTQLARDPRTGRPADFRRLQVETLMDGDAVAPWETAMLVTGPYVAFAHLETDYLGVLARRSLVATNVARVMDAARGKPVIFMGARHDDWRVQTPDGYAARVGGAGSVSSNAGGSWWGASGVGTMPHAIIAAFGGDAVAATLAFARYCRDREPDVKVVSLVDYRNDVVGDALAVARAMHERFGAGSLAAVRVDTSERLVDASLAAEAAAHGREGLGGVNPALVRRLRAALDEAGFPECRDHGVGRLHPHAHPGASRTPVSR